MKSSSLGVQLGPESVSSLGRNQCPAWAGISVQLGPDYAINGNITRFALPKNEERITFYLENFPEDLLETAQTAVLNWNRAFKKEILDVKVHNKKSTKFDKSKNLIVYLSESVGSAFPAAGIANVSEYPNGQIYNARISINPINEKIFLERIANHNLTSRKYEKTQAQIGSIILEKPTVEKLGQPFLRSRNINKSDLRKKLVYHTIVHEVGHALGLSHNKAASFDFSKHNEISSVMDYYPTLQFDSQTINDNLIGSYDIAAIQWGYYGNPPLEKFSFCDFDGEKTDWKCNENDIGDPIVYLENQLSESIKFLKSYDENVIDLTYFSPLLSYQKLILKFKDLKSPEHIISEFNRRILPRWEELLNLKIESSNSEKWENIKKIIKERDMCYKTHTSDVGRLFNC